MNDIKFDASAPLSFYVLQAHQATRSLPDFNNNPRSAGTKLVPMDDIGILWELAIGQGKSPDAVTGAFPGHPGLQLTDPQRNAPSRVCFTREQSEDVMEVKGCMH